MLTPVECHYIFKGKTRLSRWNASHERIPGLDSMPEEVQEHFDESSKKKLQEANALSDQWLEIHTGSAQYMGMKSNATILYGHNESYEHRVDHL